MSEQSPMRHFMKGFADSFGLAAPSAQEEEDSLHFSVGSGAAYLHVFALSEDKVLINWVVNDEIPSDETLVHFLEASTGQGPGTDFIPSLDAYSGQFSWRKIMTLGSRGDPEDAGRTAADEIRALFGGQSPRPKEGP